MVVGDTVVYSYYTYPVGYVDASYVYLGARVSIRGSTGAAGTTPVKGTDYWTEEDKANITQDLSNQFDTRYIPASQGVSNAGKILMVDANGNLTLSDVPNMGATGDIVGVVSESNEIVLTGALPEGTYTIKYEMEDGTVLDVGSVNLSSEQIIPVTLTLGKIDYNNNGTIVSSDTYLYSDAIPVEKNKAYRMSLVGEGSVCSVKVVSYDANDNYIGITDYNYPDTTSGATTGSWVLPVNKDAAKFRLRIYHNSTTYPAATKANIVVMKFSVSYTNLLPTALGNTGSVLEGVGYVQDKKLGSYPKKWGDCPGYFSTGFFPYTLAQAKDRVPIYVKGVTIDLTALSGGYVQMQLSPSATTDDWIGVQSITNMTDINLAIIIQLAESYYMFIPNVNFWLANDWDSKNPTLMRMCLPGTGEGVIITVDEPIM